MSGTLGGARAVRPARATPASGSRCAHRPVRPARRGGDHRLDPVQALINIGAVLGLLPVIGIPLPLVSAGGSALVPTLVALGMLLSFARHEPEPRARAARRRPAVGVLPIAPLRSATSAAAPQAREPVHVVLAGGGTAGHIEPAARPRRRAAPRDPSVGGHRARHRAGPGDAAGPRARLPARADPAGAAAAPPVVDCPAAGPAARRGPRRAATVLDRIRPTWWSASAATSRCPPTWRRGRAGCRSSSTRRTPGPGWPTGSARGSPGTSPTSYPGTPLPHAPLLGMPLRRAIATLDRAARASRGARALRARPDRPTLLVTGGSPGRAAAQRWPCRCGAARLAAAGVQVLHVTGPGKAVDASTCRPGDAAVRRRSPTSTGWSSAYAAADLVRRAGRRR